MAHPLRPDSVLAAFDLDGTLTRRDTLLHFLLFTRGWWRVGVSLLMLSPLMALALLGVCNGGRAKERLLRWHFRGTTRVQMQAWGEAFAAVAMRWLNEPVVELLRRHQREGHTVCVVSASIDDWVRPICAQLGIVHVIATQFDYDANGRLTGCFATPNCSGKEKVRRLLDEFPNRSDYKLYAYGNSHGDDALLEEADEKIKV